MHQGCGKSSLNIDSGVIHPLTADVHKNAIHFLNMIAA